MGLPSDKAQYIHRLGRTARAGKAGGGYLLLADFESSFLRTLHDLPVQPRAPLSVRQRDPNTVARRCRITTRPAARTPLCDRSQTRTQ